MVTSLIVNYWGINKSLFATCILAIYFVVKSWGALDSRKIFHEARLSYCLQSCFRDLLSDEWKNTFCTQASHFDIFWSHDCANNVLTYDKWYFLSFLDAIMISYLDDMLIFSKTQEECDVHFCKDNHTNMVFIWNARYKFDYNQVESIK